MSQRSHANPWWGPRVRVEPAPGSFFKPDEEEALPVPLRTELTVLSADDPKARTIGFSVYERLGSDVYLKSDIGTPLTKVEDMKPGLEIVARSLFGDYILMTTEQLEDGSFVGKGTVLMGVLRYDRTSWVCIAHINMKGVKRLAATLDETRISAK